MYMYMYVLQKDLAEFDAHCYCCYMLTVLLCVCLYTRQHEYSMSFMHCSLVFSGRSRDNCNKRMLHEAFCLYARQHDICTLYVLPTVCSCYFHEGCILANFASADPRDNFHCQFKSIYSNDNIRKIAKLTTRESTAKVQ